MISASASARSAKGHAADKGLGARLRCARAACLLDASAAEVAAVTAIVDLAFAEAEVEEVEEWGASKRCDEHS